MRIVTRPDLDGLASALIISANEEVDEFCLVSAQDITDKRVAITPQDILANLPYHPDCGKWFDHHLLTPSNEQPPKQFDGRYRLAPSAAQLVWEYYGKEPRFGTLVEEANRVDSAQLTMDDVLQPRGWVLLGFTLDPRTGLGDPEGYFLRCHEWLQEKRLSEVLLKEEVRDRIFHMFEQNESCCWTLMQCSQLHDNVVYTDLRRIKETPVGNRFLVYTLFPEANVSVRSQWSSDEKRVMVKVGHSIFNRTCNESVGDLMSCYGGGGHFGAGSAPLPILEADLKILEIIETLMEGS